MKKQKHFFLFRGLAREAAHWGDFISTLKTYFPGDKISCIDLPGAGEFVNTISPWSIEKIIPLMRLRFLTLRSSDAENILIAVSLGGMVATQWMKDFPEDFSRVILINTSFGDLSPIHKRLKPIPLLKLLTTPFLKSVIREKIILSIVANNHHKAENTLHEWADINIKRPMKLENILGQIIAGKKFKLKFFKPKIPVLLMTSNQDKLVSPECSMKIAQFWNTQLIVHTTAGHDLTHDDPEWVCQQTREWLNLKLFADN